MSEEAREPVAVAAAEGEPAKQPGDVSETAQQPKESQPVNEPEVLCFKVQYGKRAADLKRPPGSTVAELKLEVDRVFGVPPENQKLMFKGQMKNADDTLRQLGLKNNSKVLLIGSSRAEVEATKQLAATTSELAWDAAPKSSEEPICKQTQHAKVLAKGLPDDHMHGIKGRQVPLSEDLTAIPGLLNGQGTKVRLTFRPDLQQLWIGSATSTQKVAYNMVHKIESYPIDNNEEYSILSLQLGSSATSKYWLYFFPSQFVAALKARVMGWGSWL